MSRLTQKVILFGLLITLVTTPSILVSAQENDDDELLATIEAQATLIAELGATPAGEVVLFEEHWADGLKKWQAPIEWQVFDDVLVNDGTGPNPSEWVVAPFDPGAANYAVEAEIKFLGRNRDSSINCVDAGFGVVARGADSTGYFAGVLNQEALCSGGNNVAGIRLGTSNDEVLAQTRFTPSDGWHTYRLEVEGNTVRLLIDSRLMAEIKDNQLLDPGRVGFWSNSMQVEVQSFRVIEL